MRILFALPGAHRVHRGAEVAFEAIARNLARYGEGDEVTLIGSGPQRAGEPYRYEQVKVIPRERFERLPEVPFFRNPEMWEELTFLPGLRRRFRRSDYDVVVTCSFPYVNLALRRWRAATPGARHVWVSENGIWPAVIENLETKAFGCDGLVCINPDYYEQVGHRYPTALIPNGVDAERFHRGPSARAEFGLPEDVPIVLMVSALINAKRVDDGIRAVAEMPDAMLVVAGDGIRRDEIDALAEGLLPGRYRRMTVASSQMPNLYRSADAFLHLSRDESFGNVYIEALVTGLPCVVHDYPLTRWIYGDDGQLVDASDHELLVQELGKALANTGQDRSLQVARGVERFSWRTIADQYRTFFAETLAR